MQSPEAHPHAHGGHMEEPRLYDLLGHVFFAGRRRRVLRQVAALSGAGPGDRVLDVGCGTGHLTRIMARAVGPGGSALGVDPSWEALARARRVTRARNCSFAEGRAESLDALDGSFDVVVSSLMVHHLPGQARAQAIGEMFRVLRPGGRVVVADFRPPANRLLRRLVRPVVSDAMEHNPVHLIESMVSDAGFEKVGTGEALPWIHCVRGARPEPSPLPGPGTG